jgi:hypothetical protein
MQSLAWLNHWPAGLKLNTELSQFYASSFHTLVSISGSKYGCLTVKQIRLTLVLRQHTFVL